MRSDESILKRMRSLFNRVNYPSLFLHSVLVVVGGLGHDVVWCIGGVAVQIVSDGGVLVGTMVSDRDGSNTVGDAEVVVTLRDNGCDWVAERSGVSLMIELNVGLF